jgi:hypothetical protein
LIKSLKLEQEKSIMELRQEYVRRSEDLKHGYERKMKTVRERYDEKRKDDVSKIEQKKNNHIQKLMSIHKQAFDNIKAYYRDITHANLDLIKTLKEEVGDMKKKEQGVQKEVNDIRRLNKKMMKPLQKNLKLVEDLKKKLDVFERNKVELTQVKEDLVVLEGQEQNLSWEDEVMEQKLEKLMEERDELVRKRERTIYTVQQKTGFRNLLLEKKIGALSQDLEKTESALAEVLASTNLQPEIAGDIQNNLEDVLMSKNKQVQRLEDSLDKLKQKYAHTIQVYENKLTEYNIPLEELGFTPVRWF